MKLKRDKRMSVISVIILQGRKRHNVFTETYNFLFLHFNRVIVLDFKNLIAVCIFHF